MKLTQQNDFDCSRTIFQIEVDKQDQENIPWVWVPMTDKVMCMSAFLRQLADLAEFQEAEYKARGCAPST